MTWVPRRVFVSVIIPAGLIALGTLLSACSSGTASGASAADARDAFVAVDTASGPFVMVENLTSQPLIDINISLKSGILTFSDTIGRLEAKEKRRVRHADFSSRDGTSFSLRITTPKNVAITARDPDGKQLETTVPWQ
jgi:hypothetical protein